MVCIFHSVVFLLTFFSITHTTRKPLSDEEPGKDHHFVTLEEFEESIKMVSAN